MRRVRIFAVVAGLSLASATSPAVAGSPVLAAGATEVADTSSRRAPADAPPAVSWAPSRDTLDALRVRVGDRAIQVWNGDDHVGIRHASLDSSGVRFEIWKQDYAPWVYEGWGIDAPRSEGGGAAPQRSSRIPWSAVGRIETQQSRVLLGAAAGTLVGLGALGLASSTTGMWSDMSALVLAPAIVVSFGLLGSVVGGLAPGRTLVWKRQAAAPSTSPARSAILAPEPVVAPDTSSPAGAEEASRAGPSLAKSAPATESLARLRTRVGRRDVRVSVGEDDYKLSDARFDSSGVVFPPGGRQGRSLWADEGESPATSPIAWERVSCIRVQHSHVVLGAVAGALLGSGILIHSLKQGNGYNDDWPATSAVLAPLAVLVGASVGGMLGGSFLATWPIVWQHAPDRHGAR